MDSEQSGYRGTGMNQINNPRLAASPHSIPAAPAPVPQDGPRAGEIFQNVQVLGDLSVAEFTRTMTAITEWVSPAEGCNYCHMPTDLASDDIYTKVVSRRMLEMTRNIDKNWGDHVGGTGVTCYTCHQGNAVPVNIWFEDNSDENASRFAGNLAGQNMPHPAVGLTSLPSDPFSSLLISSQGQNSIRVLGTEGHATGQGGASIQSTEATYGLMMHLSESLGVNCTFCHQTAHFGDWSGSTNARVVAFHGIKMVQELNEQYLAPLASALPEHRLGPAGDAPKANCHTCHSGLTKPLGGAQMAADFPAFRRDK
jgi:photosynthetic reaction center cytochrome c subunit